LFSLTRFKRIRLPRVKSNPVTY